MYNKLKELARIEAIWAFLGILVGLAKTGDFPNACDFQNRISFYSERLARFPLRNIFVGHAEHVEIK